MDFRIKYIKGIGYFSQIKKGFFSKWKTIGKHVNGYGFYPNDHIEHPMEEENQALRRCKLCEQWLYNKENEPVYIEIEG